jgi:exodeoxyribonuclease VIII
MPKRNYLSVSALKQFAKSPNHYIAYCNRKFEPTPAMAFGSAVHTMILEPDQFDARYVVAPDVDRRTKLGKEKYAEYQSSIGNRESLSQAQMYQLRKTYDAVCGNEDATALLMNCEYELTVDGTLGQVPFKGIVDALNTKSGYAIDVKTCRDASPEQFGRDAYNLGYHLQASAYRLLTGVDRFYWLCVETDEPYNVALYMQSPDAFEKSSMRLLDLIEQWRKWDGSPATYSDEIMLLDYPKWAK